MIEFDDVADDGGTDEDLPQPLPPITGRRRRIVAIAAAVLVGGGLVTYAQLSRPDAKPRATTSSTPAPLPSSSSSGGLLVEHLGDRNGTLRNDVEVSVPAKLTPPACPQSSDGFASCVVSTTVPTALAGAVHRAFPTAGTGTASTATLRATEPGARPGLWYRLYRAPVGRDGTLTILVTRHESGYDVIPTIFLFGSTTVAYVRHVDARYDVQVQLRAPTAHAPSLAGLTALAADARTRAS